MLGLRVYTDALVNEILPLMAQMGLIHQIATERSDDRLERLFGERSWNIDWQAWNTLGFLGAGGATMLGTAFIDALGFEGAAKAVKVFGDLLPKGSEIANTFLRSDDVLLEAHINKVNHRMSDEDRREKQTGDTETQVTRTHSQMLQEEDAQFRLKS